MPTTATRHRVWARAPLAICVAPVATALVLAFQDGGYFTTSWGTAAIVLLGLLAAVALVVRRARWGPLEMAAMVGWGSLAGWQGLSAFWADEPSSSTKAMGLTLLYGAAFTIVLLASRGAATLRRMLELSLFATLPVTLAALGARLFPDIISGDEHGRLSTPITYWNNLALVFAFGFVLAIGVAADPTRGRILRSLAASSIPLFPLGILFAQSRGALLVLVAGCVLLLALARGRIETVWMLALAIGTSLPLLQYANAQEGLSAGEVLLRAHSVEGRRVALALLAATVACAIGCLVVGRISAFTSRGGRRRAVGIGIATAVAVVLVATLLVRPPSGGPAGWADRQFESFKQYDPRARDDATTVADRLVVAAGSGRWQNWSVAGNQFLESPLIGTGAGDYRFRWAAERDIDISVRNAHSLYLELLGESGLVGLILLLVPVGTICIAVGTTLRRRPPFALARDLGIAIAGGGAVALHLAGDWAWQMPGVVLPAVTLGAAALAASGRGAIRDVPVIASWSIAGVAVVALLILFGPVAGGARLDAARSQASEGDLTGALETARSAADLDPQSPEPLQLEANLLADLGRHRMSDVVFARAIGASPREWSIPADWASALLRRGDKAAARPLVDRALELNPQELRLRLLRNEAGG